MGDNKPQHFSEITEEMIQDWKAKYGEYALEELSIIIRAGDNPKKPSDGAIVAKFVMKQPNRHEMIAAADYANKGEAEKSNNLLIENCVLGGDMATIDLYGVVYAKIVEWGSDQYEQYQPYQSKKL